MSSPTQRFSLKLGFILLIAAISFVLFRGFSQEPFTIKPLSEWKVTKKNDIYYLENTNNNIKLSMQYGEMDWKIVKSYVLYIAEQPEYSVYKEAKEATISGYLSVIRIGRTADGSQLFYNIILKHPNRTDGFLNIEASSTPPMDEKIFHERVDNLVNSIDFKPSRVEKVKNP